MVNTDSRNSGPSRPEFLFWGVLATPRRPAVRAPLALLWLLPALAPVAPARADALTKLQPDRLAAVRGAIQELRKDWRPLPRTGPLREYRANLHVHSSLSHDSRGTRAQLVAAARAAG